MSADTCYRPARRCSSLRGLSFVVGLMAMTTLQQDCSASEVAVSPGTSSPDASSTSDTSQTTLGEKTTPVASPWSLRDDPDANRTVEQLVAAAIGETLPTFRKTTFLGVTLGEKYQEGSGDPVSSLNSIDTPIEGFLYRLKNARGPGSDRRPPAAVCVLVDEESGRIVGIRGNYNGDPGEISEDIVASFGKTDQEIEKYALGGQRGRVDVAVLKFTFEKTIVRATLNSAGQVVVTVFDRAYVERSLRAFAEAVVAGCRWMKGVTEAVQEGAKTLPPIEPLASTMLERSPSKAYALFADPVMWKQRNDAKTGNTDPLHVAGAWIDSEDVWVIVDPFISPTLGVPRLKRTSPRCVDSHGHIPTIASSDCLDLFADVANRMLQKTFPPATDKITIYTFAPDFEMCHPVIPTNGWQPGGSLRDPRATVSYMRHPLGGRRYEWRTKDGAEAVAGAGGCVAVIKPMIKQPRGL
jgi:hypothetical protein